MPFADRLAPILLAVVILSVLPAPAAGQDFHFDDFPRALANYVTGGWQGPFGDGTGGTIGSNGDGTGIILDGTVNALAYAIRRSPVMIDVNLTVDFSALNRDMTQADQFSLLLAWNNSNYPGQSSCPPCSSPTPESGIVVNFNIGRGTVRVSEVTNFVATEIAVASSALAVGPANEALVRYANRNLSIDLNGVKELAVPNINKPAGVIGFMAYRMGVVVDSLIFELPERSPAGSLVSPVPPFPIWLIALVAGIAGGGVVSLGTLTAGWLRKHRKLG